MFVRMQNSLSPRAIAAAACLLVPSIAVLIVPYFNRIEPRLFGMPFFYAYQLIWVVAGTLFLAAAYILYTPISGKD